MVRHHNAAVPGGQLRLRGQHEVRRVRQADGEMARTAGACKCGEGSVDGGSLQVCGGGSVDGGSP